MVFVGVVILLIGLAALVGVFSAGSPGNGDGPNYNEPYVYDTATPYFTSEATVMPVAAETAAPPQVAISRETGAMLDSRSHQTATLLQDGRVLVAGGIGSDGQPLSSAEVYDPASGTFSGVTDMIWPRAGQTATLLDDGRVLIAGGRSTGGPTATSELFDPTTDEFRDGPDLALPAADASAVKLPDGRVVIVGGNDGESDSEAVQIFDPATDTMGLDFKLSAPLSGAAAALLPSGELLLAGGVSNGSLESSIRILDLGSGSEQMLPLDQPVRDASACLVPDGRVVIVGGYDASGQPVDRAVVFDPGTSAVQATFTLAAPRGDATATVVGDGNVVIVGGVDGRGDPNSLVESIEAAGGSLAIGAPGATLQPRSAQTATLLPDGDLLVAGGDDADGAPTSSAELISLTGGA